MPFVTTLSCNDYRSHARYWQIPSISRKALYHGAVRVHITHCPYLAIYSSCLFFSEELEFLPGILWWWYCPAYPVWIDSLILCNVSMSSAGLECACVCVCVHMCRAPSFTSPSWWFTKPSLHRWERKEGRNERDEERGEDGRDLWKRLLV